MVFSAGHRLLVAFVGLLLALQLGCANGPLSDLAALNPFRTESDAGGRYGPTPGQQMAAIEAIGVRARGLDPPGQEQAAAELARRFGEEPDPMLREQIVNALAGLNTPSATDALRLALQDRDSHVRQRAVWAWSKHPVADAVPMLAETLASDTDVDVRLAATKALGKFKDPAAVRPLSVALEDSNPALQRRAVESLREITDREFGTDLEQWRRFARGEVIDAPHRPSLANHWFGGWF